MKDYYILSVVIKINDKIKHAVIAKSKFGKIIFKPFNITHIKNNVLLFETSDLAEQFIKSNKNELSDTLKLYNSINSTIWINVITVEQVYGINI